MKDERSANVIDKKVGQRVRARRLELGISQEGLAEMLGVTFQQVQKYEKGTNRIAVSRLYAISLALEIHAGRFFDNLSAKGAVAEGRQEYIDDALSTPEGTELMALFATIKTAKIRRRALDLIRAIVEEAEGKR